MSLLLKSWLPHRLPTLSQKQLNEKASTTSTTQDTASTASTRSSLTSRLSNATSKLFTPATSTSNASQSQLKENVDPSAVSNEIESAATPQRSVSVASTFTDAAPPPISERSSLSSIRTASSFGTYVPGNIPSKATTGRPAIPPLRLRHHPFLGRQHAHCGAQGIAYDPPPRSPHRTVSLPPLPEAGATSRPVSRGGSIRTVSAYHSRTGRGGGLHINGPDIPGFRKVAIDIQPREVVSTIPFLRGRSLGSMAGVGGQMDGAAESTEGKSSLGEVFRALRSARSSDTDRATRGESEVPPLASYVSDYGGDEEMGKEEEWEKNQPRQEQRDWKRKIADAYDRVRCWVGFRFSGLLW